MTWVYIGLCLVGLVESWLISVGVLSQARGYAKLSGVMAFINVMVWFTIVKIAPEIDWIVVPAYSAMYGVGVYMAVRWFPKEGGRNADITRQDGS